MLSVNQVHFEISKAYIEMSTSTIENLCHYYLIWSVIINLIITDNNLCRITTCLQFSVMDYCFPDNAPLVILTGVCLGATCLFVCVFTLDALQIRLWIMFTWWKWEQTSLLPPFILLLSGLQASLSLSLPLQSPQPYVSGLISYSCCIGPRLFCVLRA